MIEGIEMGHNQVYRKLVVVLFVWPKPFKFSRYHTLHTVAPRADQVVIAITV